MRCWINDVHVGFIVLVRVAVVVKHCFTSLFGTKGPLSDIMIRYVVVN